MRTKQITYLCSGSLRGRSDSLKSLALSRVARVLASHVGGGVVDGGSHLGCLVKLLMKKGWRMDGGKDEG
jgi:hypothetical protein